MLNLIVLLLGVGLVFGVKALGITCLILSALKLLVIIYDTP